MDILQQAYQFLLVQPAYNLVIAIYTSLGQNTLWLTLVIIGLAAGIVFLPLMIRGYYDQVETRALDEKIQQIKAESSDPEQQQEKILKLLRQKDIRFQSESIFLFGQAVVLFLLYPIFIHHWTSVEPDLGYSFVTAPTTLNSTIGTLDLTHSSPTLTLLPAVLLFIELRQSYREQQFLTGFVDRWYPVILPLFVYFLLFWLPSALSLVLSMSLLVSLYVRGLLTTFARLRQKPATT